MGASCRNTSSRKSTWRCCNARWKRRRVWRYTNLALIRWRHIHLALIRWRHSSPHRPTAGSSRLRIPLVRHDGRLGADLGCLVTIRVWVGMVRKCLWLDHRETETEPV